GVRIRGQQQGRLAHQVDSIDDLIEIEVSVAENAGRRAAGFRIDLPEPAPEGRDPDQAAVERDGQIGHADQRQTGSVARPRRATVDRAIQADLRPHVDRLAVARVYLHDVDGDVGERGRGRAVH